jgi:hypothetical protein
MPATIDGSDLAAINAVLSGAMQDNIALADHADPKVRRGIDFDLLARAEAAAQRLVEANGPDRPLGIPGTLAGVTPAFLLAQVRSVAAQAEPHRPKARRA